LAARERNKAPVTIEDEKESCGYREKKSALARLRRRRRPFPQTALMTRIAKTSNESKDEKTSEGLRGSPADAK